MRRGMATYRRGVGRDHIGKFDCIISFRSRNVTIKNV